jgi:hypothetical protein
MFERRATERSLAEIAQTLEEECDEVIALLEDPDLEPSVEAFLRIEGSHRFTPRRYFYQIRGTDGRMRAQTGGAQTVTLPLPTRWNYTKNRGAVRLETVQRAGSDEPFLVRSERVVVVGMRPSSFKSAFRWVRGGRNYGRRTLRMRSSPPRFWPLCFS